MNNPRLAARYAKSLIDIATELKQLDEVQQDILVLKSIISKSRDFVLMLNSPIIHTDKKYKIIKQITGGKISNVTDAFIKLLCKKNREDNLPAVTTAFIEQYNRIRGLHIAKLTTATPISKELTDSFISKIKESTSYDKVMLDTVVDDDIIGGYILEMEGKLVDKSIRRNLHEVKKQFANNDYLHKLR